MTQNLISSTDSWKALTVKAKDRILLANSFANDKERWKKLCYCAGDWTLDFSRQLVDDTTMQLLFDIAKQSGWEKAREDMFAGKEINTTEKRAVLHTALRDPDRQDARQVLEKMSDFTQKVFSGDFTGYTGKKMRTAVAIGIGGSNLGPEMAYRALLPYKKGLEVRFVANVDPSDLSQALEGIRAEETLFVISSKTFTTTETMQNASAARDWLIKELGSDKAVEKHFVAVSTNTELVKNFGIHPDNMFVFWDWVGGRFSMSSAIGLPLMLSIGSDHFNDMLNGFHIMDTHYRTAPLSSNVPAVMALINLWNASFLNLQTHAVVAYDEYLSLFPDHLQQLVMESLGKRVTQDGSVVDYMTCPVFFGGVGTNVQHSYFQLLHQGSGITIPVDFIALVESPHPIGEQHKDLYLNMVAQANVLAFGENAAELKAMGTKTELIEHKVIPGNKPSSIITSNKLSPNTLGQLIALYEHMVHAWGTCLGINAFDQFGVEAGKRKAKALGSGMKGPLTPASALELLRAQ